MKVVLLFLFFVLFVGSNASIRQPQPPAPSNTPDGKHVCFGTSDNSMGWPLTNPFDTNVLLIHGPHSVEMFKQYKLNPPTNARDTMHQRHSRKMLELIIEFFASRPDYNVDPIICYDLRLLTRLSSTTRSKNNHVNQNRSSSSDDGLSYSIDYAEPSKASGTQTTGDDGLNYSIDYADPINNPTQKSTSGDEGLNYSIDYADPITIPPQKSAPSADDGLKYSIDYADPITIPPQKSTTSGDEGLSYNIDYAEPVIDDDQKLSGTEKGESAIALSHFVFNQMAAKSKTQNQLYEYLEGQNFGRVLMRESESPELLSRAEKTYLNAWRNDQSIRLGALGIYCMEGYGPKSKELLTQLLA